MGKKMRRKAGVLWDIALVIAGWVAFMVGSFMDHPLTVLPLAVARVLP